MKAAIQKENHYYKYIYSVFEQPTLTSDSSDKMFVGVNFSNNTSTYGTLYQAFAPNTGSIGFYCDEYKGNMSIYIYFTKPVKLTNISFKVLSKDSASGNLYKVTLYAGNTPVKAIGTVNENTTYTGAINNNDYYTEYRLYMENGGVAHDDRIDISNILLTGQVREVIEGTSEDYDYYIKGKKTYIVNEVETLKAIKSYEKGQYYGN